MATVSTTRKRRPQENQQKNKQKNINTAKEDEVDITPEEYKMAQCQMYFTLGGAFLFSCLCTAILWYVFFREKEIQFSNTKTIKVITLPSPQTQFAADAIKGRKPLLIKNSVTTQWLAMNVWSPQYLQSKLTELNGIYQNENRWFGPYYDINKPLVSYTTHSNPYKTNVTLTSKEFFDRIQRPSTGRYHYFTGDIDQLGEWALEDISPIDELLLPNPARSSINIWMGQPFVVAHCHYDGYHNFYAQLYGQKKFTLFRPTEWPGLYPYPFLHPSHAQAQVNLSHLGEGKKFPLSYHLEAYEVVLNPGDILYMPPLWFHHVESLDVSISVNVWTDSSQTSIMEKVFSLSVPHEEVQWAGDHLKAMAGSVVVYRAVEQVCKVMNCPATDKFNDKEEKSFDNGHSYFMYKLWRGRFSKLMDNGVLHSNFTTKKGHRKSLLCEVPLPALFYEGIAQKLGQTKISTYFKQLPKLIKKLPRDTWELWFGNYIEYIAAQSVDILDIGIFLKNFDSCIKYFPQKFF